MLDCITFDAEAQNHQEFACEVVLLEFRLTPKIFYAAIYNQNSLVDVQYLADSLFNA